MDKLSKETTRYTNELINKLAQKGSLLSSELTDKGTKVVGTLVTTADTSAHFLTDNIYKYLPTFIVAALMLLVSSSWNSSLQSAIDYYVPADTRKKYNAWAKVGYSCVLSIVIVIVIAVISYYLPVEQGKK
jgi:hypothetical protein